MTTKKVFVVGADEAVGFLFAEADTVIRARWQESASKIEHFRGDILELAFDTDAEAEAAWTAYSVLGGFLECDPSQISTIGLFGDSQ